MSGSNTWMSPADHALKNQPPNVRQLKLISDWLDSIARNDVRSLSERP